MHNFQGITEEVMEINPFKLIGQDWMLVTSGDKEKVNTMTASWGGVGVLWKKNVVYIFVRESRYTKEFIDKTGKFSLTFFDEKYKKELKYLGVISGRDEDKIDSVKFNVNFHDKTETPFIDEGNLVLICKRLSETRIPPEDILEKGIIEEVYADNDFHHMYVGEIVEFLAR